MVNFETIIFALSLTAIAALATGLGAILIFFVEKPSQRVLGALMGFSAGVMIGVSFLEMIPRAIEELTVVYGSGNQVPFTVVSLAFVVGMCFMAVFDFIIPHDYKDEIASPGEDKGYDKSLRRTGTLVALGIALHNFPEGLVTLSGALVSFELGLVLAFAIALHNIPEGLSVAVPLYMAEGKKKKAFGYAFLSGVAELIGALIGLIFLLPLLQMGIVGYALAIVSGIMVFISIDEILPAAHKADNKGHAITIGIILGFFVMIGTLIMLNTI